MATKKEQLRAFFTEIHSKSDQVVEALLLSYFFFGIGLSFFYDTYLVGAGVGLLSLALYFGTKLFFKGSTVNQYIASFVAGIFMAQFIYQMHGLFEMHFTAFIAIIALITYQNKYIFIPQLVFVVVHHSTFAYIQYLGYTNDNEAYKQIYFTQLDYMDFQTFLFHAGLYAAGVVIAAIYAHNLEKNTIRDAENIIKLQKSEDSMKVNINIANEIASGNLDAEFENTDGNEMSQALEEMRTNLKESAEREKHEKFVNVGIAEVSDIIRNYSESLDELANQLISYLVRYLKVNQGGIFVLMDEGTTPYLELKGCYAYDRKKFIDKKIEIGQGLVGQCYIERDVLHLREIPEGYVNITSGLGESTPTDLLILPIQNDRVIEGVMEIAAFRNFEKYEIEFLKKICENIAATITSAKVNSKTKILYEQSQQQAEEMRAQEEEMRQNMEELAATQEEMERKSIESSNRINAINNSGIGSIEFDLHGNIVRANETFCRLMKYTKDELEGHHHSIFVDTEYAQSDEYDQFWKDLGNGIMHHGQYLRFDKLGNPVHLVGAYSVIKNANGDATGILKFVVDVTAHMEENERLKAVNEELNKKLDTVE